MVWQTVMHCYLEIKRFLFMDDIANLLLLGAFLNWYYVLRVSTVLRTFVSFRFLIFKNSWSKCLIKQTWRIPCCMLWWWVASIIHLLYFLVINWLIIAAVFLILRVLDVRHVRQLRYWICLFLRHHEFALFFLFLLYYFIKHSELRKAFRPKCVSSSAFWKTGAFNSSQRNLIGLFLLDLSMWKEVCIWFLFFDLTDAFELLRLFLFHFFSWVSLLNFYRFIVCIRACLAIIRWLWKWQKTGIWIALIDKFLLNWIRQINMLLDNLGTWQMFLALYWLDRETRIYSDLQLFILAHVHIWR